MASVVECLLALKDNVTTGLRQNITNSAAKTPLRRKLELEESDEPVISVMTPGRRSGEERWKGHWDSKSQQRSILHSGMVILLFL